MASLRDLGLSEYEARVYRALLDTGPTTAKELSRASEVPMGRIYDVLASIETHGLVRAQTASRPKKYVAVEPDTADLLVERLATADESVVMVASALSRQFDVESVGDRVSEELDAAVERGVEVSLLMRPDLVTALPETVGERYLDRLAPNERFATRTSDAVERTFTVIDGVETCIEVPHPLDSSKSFAMIDFQDPAFATEILEEFTPRWERAEPLALGEG